MPLSVDMRRIVKAEVVPWEIEEGLYGIVYTTLEGREEGDLIGTKAEAKASRLRVPIGRPKSPAYGPVLQFDRRVPRRNGGPNFFPTYS